MSLFIVSERSIGGKPPLNLRPLGTANYNPCDFRRDLEGVTWNSVSTPDGPPVGVNDLWG